MTAGLLLMGGVPCTVLATNSMSFLGLAPFSRARCALHVRFARFRAACASRPLPEPE